MIAEEDDDSSSAMDDERNKKMVITERRRLTDFKFMVQCYTRDTVQLRNCIRDSYNK